LLNNGVGSLIGYLGSGWWFAVCAAKPVTHWPLFWWGLTAMIAGVMGYFLWAFCEEPVRVPIRTNSPDEARMATTPFATAPSRGLHAASTSERE